MARSHELYLVQLAAAARSLEAVQGADGGWGLTPTSVSSIVNTSEALVVLRAAGSTGSVGRGFQYLIDAIPLFCQPQGDRVGAGLGRGERTRFVSFGLDGLLTYPELAFEAGGLKVIEWCLRWLAASRIPADARNQGGGWAESRGETLVSIHQTARIVAALSRLLVLDRKYHVLSDELRELSRSMASTGAGGLLRLRGEDGSWPVRPGKGIDGDGEPFSPTKTALAAMALGYYEHIEPHPVIREARAAAARWLLAHDDLWIRRTEEDTDEKGTHWVHLAYAECIRGILAGYQTPPAALSRSWMFLTSLWSETELLWTEPGKPEGKATIRAAYHTVMAHESGRHPSQSQLLLPAPLSVAPLTTIGAVRSVQYEPSVERGIKIQAENGSITVELTNALYRTFGALIHSGGSASSADLSQITGKSIVAVHKDIGRLNEVFRDATDGDIEKLILSHRHASGEYRYSIAEGRSE